MLILILTLTHDLTPLHVLTFTHDFTLAHAPTLKRTLTRICTYRCNSRILYKVYNLHNLHNVYNLHRYNSRITFSKKKAVNKVSLVYE